MSHIEIIRTEEHYTSTIKSVNTTEHIKELEPKTTYIVTYDHEIMSMHNTEDEAKQVLNKNERF